MRGEDGAFMRAQRLGNPWGSFGARPVFEGEHVGGVGAEGAAVQGGGDGVLVDDRSAADVDEHGVGGSRASCSAPTRPVVVGVSGAVTMTASHRVKRVSMLTGREPC